MPAAAPCDAGAHLSSGPGCGMWSVPACGTCTPFCIFQNKHYAYVGQQVPAPCICQVSSSSPGLLIGCDREGPAGPPAPASQCLPAPRPPLSPRLPLALQRGQKPGREGGEGGGRVGRRHCDNSEGHDSILVSSSGKRPRNVRRFRARALPFPHPARPPPPASSLSFLFAIIGSREK